MSDYWDEKNWEAEALDGEWIPLGTFAEIQDARETLIAYWDERGEVVEACQPRQPGGQWAFPGTGLGETVQGLISPIREDEPPFPLTGE